MRLPSDSHLCYCFNVLDEESGSPLSESFIAGISRIRASAGCAPGEAFAVGLWLNRRTMQTLSKQSMAEQFAHVLEKNNLYCPTVNAFPYATFHGGRVKENVYLPDWRSEERLEYSEAVVGLLSRILPEGCQGSISTVPGGYRQFISAGDIPAVAANLMRMNEHLAKIQRDTGRRIVLAVEFEPDCIWESAGEFIEFKDKHLSALDDAENLVGVCYDCSHAEVVGANPDSDISSLRRANIPIPKVQISAALSARMPDAKDALAKFADGIYLHQASIFEDGRIKARFGDLPEMLSADSLSGEAISHYHLPIFFEPGPDAPIRAAKKILLGFARVAGTGGMPSTVFEIETYTYSVLPGEVFSGTVDDMIAREYRFFLDSRLHNPT